MDAMTINMLTFMLTTLLSFLFYLMTIGQRIIRSSIIKIYIFTCFVCVAGVMLALQYFGIGLGLIVSTILVICLES